MRKPFWRQSRNCYYVKDSAGRFVRLDPDAKKAEDMWQAMLAAKCDRGTRATILGVAEAFLNEHEAVMTRGRFVKVENYVLRFVEFVGQTTLVASVTKKMVLDWIRETKPGRLKKDGSRGKPKVWSLAAQQEAARDVVRVLRWAREEGVIEKNPLHGIKLPTPEPRREIVPDELHQQLVERCLRSEQSRSFAVYLIASRCGARPQQIREVTASDVASDGMAWVFQRHKTAKKTGKPLIVYLSPCLQTLTKILAASRPQGSLFRNDLGVPWKKDTVSQRFRRLREEMKIPAEVKLYAYRHTFATDSLLAGNSVAVVAQLLGHTSTAMVGRVYGHLEKHPEHLLAAVAATTAKRLGGS